MYNVRKVLDGVWWTGAQDRRLALFENTYEVPAGMSYNNYVIVDEKTCLMDGIDAAVEQQFHENLAHVLGGRPLDYMVVDHMEPDHCAAIPALVEKYPAMKIVATAKAFRMMEQFYDFDVDSRKIVVKEGDTLCLGEHTLQFIMAPMVHWPEVMVSYEITSKILFAADAFGAYGALSGGIFADEVEWERDWPDETRRYYTNIVGKYGPQTNALLKKAGKLEINYICPLHGVIWRKDFHLILDRYKKWATYTPEINSVAIFYGSVYSGTENAADILSVKLAELGVRNVRVFDVSKTSLSEMLSRAFEYSTWVFAAATYNMGIFDRMQFLLHDIHSHNLRNRWVGLIENGTWGPLANSLMKKELDGLKDITYLEPEITIHSGVKEDTVQQLDTLAHALAQAVRDNPFFEPDPHTVHNDPCDDVSCKLH